MRAIFDRSKLSYIHIKTPNLIKLNRKTALSVYRLIELDCKSPNFKIVVVISNAHEINTCVVFFLCYLPISGQDDKHFLLTSYEKS